MFGHARVHHPRPCRLPLEIPALQAAAEVPLCADCVRHEGLCGFHAEHGDQYGRVLPELAEPSWPRMIGDPYVCEKPDCHEHAQCLDRAEVAAPRAACQCHNCGQRRWADARAKKEAQAMTAEAARVKARKARKLAKRLQKALAGESTPSRPRRVA